NTNIPQALLDFTCMHAIRPLENHHHLK
ncbi:hypothetical protein CISIN_1g0419162mg, partial [Citrus sinensis]